MAAVGGAAEGNGVQVGAEGRDSMDNAVQVAAESRDTEPHNTDVVQEARSPQAGRNNGWTRTTHKKAQETQWPKGKWSTHRAATTGCRTGT